MHFFGHYIGVTQQTETLLWTLLGICCTTFDMSLFRLKDDLFEVWSLNLDAILFSDKAQIFMKYFISGIVLIRTLSIHIYLAMYIVMLWPIIFEDRPGLILPWLTVGAIRNLATVFLSFAAGNYICFQYFFVKPICLEFLVWQIIEHGPSIYAWTCVLSYYKQLKGRQQIVKQKVQLEEIVKRRRRRTRSLMRKLCSYEPNTERQLVSISTIENVVNQLTSTLHRPNTRSLDSLLTNLAAEADQEELLNMAQMKSIEDETDLNIQEKTKRLLDISDSEVEEARTFKRTTSSLSMSDIVKYSKYKDGSLRTYMNVFAQKSEYSVTNRRQSDQVILLRASKSGRSHGKSSTASSETEICSVPMSDDGNSSTYFACYCDKSDARASDDRLILSYKGSASGFCTRSDCKNAKDFGKEDDNFAKESHLETIRTFIKDDSATTFDANFDKVTVIDKDKGPSDDAEAVETKPPNKSKRCLEDDVRSISEGQFYPKFLYPPSIFVYTLAKTSQTVQQDLFKKPSYGTFSKALGDDLMDEQRHPQMDHGSNFKTTSTDQSCLLSQSIFDDPIEGKEHVASTSENQIKDRSSEIDLNESVEVNEAQESIETSDVKTCEVAKFISDEPSQENRASKMELIESSAVEDAPQSSKGITDFKPLPTDPSYTVSEPNFNNTEHPGAIASSISANKIQIGHKSELNQYPEVKFAVRARKVVRKKGIDFNDLSEALNRLFLETEKVKVRESEKQQNRDEEKQKPKSKPKPIAQLRKRTATTNKESAAKPSNRTCDAGKVATKRKVAAAADIDGKRSCIRYSKEEKCHHDGFMLAYLNRLKKKDA